MRTITINYGPGVDGSQNCHDAEVVNEYGETTGLLTLGELLEHVIHTLQGKGAYPMLTPERWEQRRQRIRDRLAPAEAADPDLLTEDPDHGEHLAA